MNELLAAADRNMRAYWTAFTSGCPAPGRAEREGAVLLSSGLPVPIFNPTFVDRDPADAGALVADVVSHYDGLGVPFLLYFRDEVAPSLAAACAAAGLVEHYQPPLMLLDPIVAAPAPPPGVDIEVVDAQTVAQCGVVLADGFGMPRELAALALPSSIVDVDQFTGVLASVDGEPVSTAAVFVAEDLAGIYNVATVPSARGRGIGAAVTWAAVEHGAAAGCTRSILQASGEGAPVYARMGFTTPDRYRQFERG